MPDKTRVRLMKVTDDIVASSSRRVLMLSSVGEMGGAERSYLELLRHLSKSFAVHACVPPESPLSRMSSLQAVTVHQVPMRRFRRTINPFVLAGQLRALHQSSKAIVEICKNNEIELIHANTDSAAIMAWEVSRQANVPFVWHCRDHRPMHGFARTLSGAAAAVVAISKSIREHLLREGVREDKIHLIYNGIDTDRFHPPAARGQVRALVRSALMIPASRPVVLCVAAYVPWKKIEVFYQSLQLLLARVPNTLGILVGSDLSGLGAGYERDLERKRQGLNLGPECLQILRERDDVPDLMAAADVLVSCSENEPFGRVIVEAGAAGLPVVSTRSGAKPEIIEDGINGMLVEAGDAASISAACSRLLNDDGLRLTLGEAGRRIVAEKFHVRRTAGEMADLFINAAAARPGS